MNLRKRALVKQSFLSRSEETGLQGKEEQPTGVKVTGASHGRTATGQLLGFAILRIEGGGGPPGLLCRVGRAAKLALY